MNRAWLGVLGGAAFAVCAISPAARAADHLDGAAVKTEKATDINDVYAWMSPDKAKVYLAMTVFPQANATSKFSNAAKYVFHLNSSSAFGMPATEVLVICSFDATDAISCWVTKGNETLDYVTGVASAAEGISSMSGKTKVFAGLRDDPFFFNLEGFKQVANNVTFASPGLMKDAAGCPMLDMGTSQLLVGQLSTAPGGGAAQNFFAALNTLALVVTVDTALVTPGGPTLGVWASTNR